MAQKLTGISSMATRQILADLATMCLQQQQIEVIFESVGGLEAAKIVAAGAPYDVVVLATNAIDKLIASGHVLAASKASLAHSAVAIAVASGQATPDISSEQALRATLLDAPRIGYSTGPSGVALLELVARWGLGEALREKLIQAPTGVPVGQLLSTGEIALGFQQLSELMHLPGIMIVGTMPSGCEINTTFSGGICAQSTQPDYARALLNYLCSPAADAVKRRNGMEPA